MARGNLIIAVLLFGLGVVISVRSYLLGLGRLSAPDAGTLPFGLGVALIVCATVLLVRSLRELRSSHGSDLSVWSSVNFTKVSLILGALLLYILLLERLGFLASSFLVQLLLFKVAGDQRWGVALLQTLITLAMVYVIFFWGLGVYVTLFPAWIY
jgi:putative tricarboxylic transport membrane protein